MPSKIHIKQGAGSEVVMIYSKFEDYERDRKELIDILKFGEVFKNIFDVDKMSAHVKESISVCDKILNILKQSTWSNETTNSSSHDECDEIFNNIQEQLSKNKKDVFILFAGTDTGESIRGIHACINCTTIAFVSAISNIISNYAKESNLKESLLCQLIIMAINMDEGKKDG